MFIGGVAAGIVSSILALIPVLGWLLGVVLCCGVSVLGIIGIINAINGQAKELPLIGKFRILK